MRSFFKATSFEIILLTTVIFTTLKLSGQLHWSWWAITSPLWLGGLAAALVVLVYLVYSVINIINHK